LLDAHAVQYFSSQAFDGVTPDRRKRPDLHGNAFPEGFTEALAQARAMELRPLDLAGILSRAATIYAANAGRFVAMIVTFIAPLTVLQYFVTLREQPQLDATIAWMQLPQNVQARHLPPVFGSPNILLFALVSSVAGYLVMAFAVAAVAAGVAAGNRNERVSYGACVLAALRRWCATIGAVLLLLLLATAAGLAVAAAILVPVSAAVTLAPGAGLAISAFAFLVILVAYGLLGTMLLVVGAAAIYAATFEDRAPADAVRRTLRRICNRAEWGRALVCASVVSAMVIATTACADILGFALFAHHPALYLALDALARAGVVPFAAIVFAVYYFDLRVRQEGYDLQLRVDRLGVAGGGDGRYAPTRYLSGEERALVAAFLERRESLSQPYRRDLAACIAAPARARVPDDLAAMDDEALLERL
jgi:hypothetical protein